MAAEQTCCLWTQSVRRIWAVMPAPWLATKISPRLLSISGLGEDPEMLWHQVLDQIRTVCPLWRESHAQCCMQHTYNNCQTHQSMFTLSIILVACFGVGLLFAIMVVLLQLTAKKKEEKKTEERCAGWVHVPSNCSSDFYMTLDIHSMSLEYDTLDTVRHCSAGETVHDNLPQHQPAIRWEVLNGAHHWFCPHTKCIHFLYIFYTFFCTNSVFVQLNTEWINEQD